MLTLVSCTNEKDVVEKTEDAISLEEQIHEVMNQHDYPPHTIISYEIKDDFIYVFTDKTSSLNVAILKHSINSIEWIYDYTSIENISIYDPDYPNMPVLTVVKTKDKEISNVKVLGEYAKAVQYSKNVNDDYTSNTRYWIHFTEMTESYTDLKSLPVKSIEIIK